MQVFKNWEQSFLWMDQYCISQSDRVEEETLVVKMDRVYKGAHLNIYVLASSTTDDGITGCRQHFRSFNEV